MASRNTVPTNAMIQISDLPQSCAINAILSSKKEGLTMTTQVRLWSTVKLTCVLTGRVVEGGVLDGGVLLGEGLQRQGRHPGELPLDLHPGEERKMIARVAKLAIKIL